MKSIGEAQYYAPVGYNRTRVDKWSGKSICCAVVLLSLVFPAAFTLGLFAAPSPFEEITYTSPGPTWNKWSGTLPSSTDNVERFNQYFTLKVQLENKEYEVEGLNAEVDVRVKLKGRSDEGSAWEDLFEVTRTRTLECEKGEQLCKSLTLLYDPAPFYGQYNAEIEIAKDRAHTYGFVSKANYIFAYCRPHWTFYEASIKFAFLIIGIWVLYDFHDRITCGSPFDICCCRRRRSTSLIQPEQRLVGALLFALTCLNDWPLFVYLLTGGWGAAMLSEAAQLAFAFVLILVWSTMCIEVYRADRILFGGYRKYMSIVFAVGVLWSLEVTWLIYTRAVRASDSSYNPMIDDEAAFVAVRSIAVVGSVFCLFGAFVNGCYVAGIADERPVVFSQAQDRFWLSDRPKRALFFWLVSFVWLASVGIDALLWALDTEIDIPWKDTLADHERGITLTTVLFMTNAYVVLLAYAFCPAKVPKKDESMVAYLNKFHI